MSVVEVLSGAKRWEVVHSDWMDFMGSLPADSVSLVFGSPPYRLARTYGIDFSLADQAWVDWMVKGFHAALRVCTGLVAFVLEGQTKDYRWTAEPALLMADLHRAGVNLRRPCIYRRIGIPGSGGPDWLRCDFEYIVCATRSGRLPWSDNTACGHAPKWAPGGEMSHRLADGQRVNQWGMNVHDDGSPTATRRGGDGAGGDIDVRQKRTKKPSHKVVTKAHTKRRADGDTEDQTYTPPVVSNPGNVIQETFTAEEVADMLGEVADVVDCKVGGGLMGHKLCHENEAPFPESLCEFFIRSFCPPGGIVLDPFGGSGTTSAVAIRLGRRALSCDVRESQVELSRKRISRETPSLFGGLPAHGKCGDS